jgi:hypothetical protein
MAEKADEKCTHSDGMPPMDIGIGLNIGQDQIDHIDDLQSPPNSPGLVLPAMIPNTNDRIDFFALESDAKVNGEGRNKTGAGEVNRNINHANVPKSPVVNDSIRYDREEEGKEGVLGCGIDIRLSDSNEFTKPRNRSSPSVIAHDDSPMNLTASSDSYFSRARKTRTPTSLRERRMSDMSDRSDYYGSVASFGSYETGSVTGSMGTESDTEITGSPTAKYVKRRRSTNKYCDGVNTNDTNVKGITATSDDNARSTGLNLLPSQYDDGVVFRTLSNTLSVPASDAGYDSSISESRATNRSISRRGRSGYPFVEGDKESGGEKSSKSRGGDSSSTGTAQIFKNLLILEESLRQQFAEQQKLRYKYTIFLAGLLVVFLYSAYLTTTQTMYSVTSETLSNGALKNSNYYYDLEKNGNAITTGDSLIDISVPEFPTIVKNSELNSIADDSCTTTSHVFSENEVRGGNGVDEPSLEVEDSGYLTMNIIYRIVSIITGMTLLLFYLTGEYTRTISRPRKFLTTANKGIRQLNVRLVKVKVSYRERFAGLLSWGASRAEHQQQQQQQSVKSKSGAGPSAQSGRGASTGSGSGSGSNSSRHRRHEVRLVLNPRVFSTGAREQWELYRSQFWSLQGISAD